MLNGNLCIFIDSLVPSSGKNCHDFLRLEYLSACSFLKNDNLSIILAKTPRRLYESLFQAVICEYFYEGNEKKLKKYLSILLSQWPYETLILKNLMPSLPPSSEKFYHYNNRSCGPLKMVLSDLQKTYDKIIDLLRQAFLKMVEEMFESENLCRIVKKIDVTNLKSTVNPLYLLNAIKIMGNLNSLNTSKRIEFVCDAWIHCWEEKALRAVNEIVDFSSKPESGIAIYFKKAQLYKYPPHSHLVEPLFRALANSGTEYIEGDGSSDNNGITKFRFKLHNLYGLGVPNQCPSFYNIFLDKNELKELNFSYNNLRGELGPITRLSKGLQYLNLSTCSLNISDLDLLAKSPHMNSLQQLNLSHNNFSLSTDKHYGLIVLIRSLSSAEIIELEECQVHTWPLDMLELLADTSNELSKLTILNIKHKQFKTSQISSLFALGESNSLKYLSVSLPIEAYASLTDEHGVIDKVVIHNACTEIRKSINKFRKDPIHVAIEYHV